jgi:hypothetical protein
MSTPSGEPGAAARPPWLIDRDLDAVAAHLDPWILAAEPDHDARTASIPLLGTPEWMAADKATRNAAVALYVIACLAQREPVVIAARLAAEIAADPTAYLVTLRPVSHAINEGMSPATGSGAPHEPPHAPPRAPRYQVEST